MVEAPPLVPVKLPIVASKRPPYLDILILLIVVFGVFSLLSPHILLKNLVAKWDRNKIEEILASKLGRPVDMATAHVHIGLFGLGIKIEDLQIRELDGKPFIKSPEARIELAFLPLISGRAVVQSFSVEKPEIWLERIADNKWNFSDIPSPADINSLVELYVDNAVVHVLDQRPNTAAQFPNTTWKKLNVHLSHHFGSVAWPFDVSVSEFVDGKESKFKLEGTGSGPLDKFLTDKYRIKAQGTSVYPMTLHSMADGLPEVIGKLDFDCKGRGTLQGEFDGEARLKSDDIRITPPGLGPLRLVSLKTETSIKVTPQTLAWTNLTIQVGSSQFRSDGALKDWRKDVPLYAAKITGDIDDLGTLLKHVDIPWVVTGLRSLPNNLAVKGTIATSGKISAEPKNEQFTTSVTLDHASVKLKQEPPLEATNVAGQLDFDKAGLHIKHITGQFDGTDFVATGKLIPGKNVDANLSAKKVHIAAVRNLLKAANIGSFDKFVDAYAFAGKMEGTIRDIAANITGKPSAADLKFSCKLEDVHFWDQKHKEFLIANDGIFHFKDKSFALEKVKGKLGTGTFIANGYAGLTPNSPWAFTSTGTLIDIASLKQGVRVANFDFPWLDDRILSGRIKTGDIALTGSFLKPKLFMSCQPEDLVYIPLGPSKPFKMKSGLIVYDNDKFEVTKLTMDGPNSKMKVTAAVRKASTDPNLMRLKLESSNIDIGEILSFANANTNPAVIRKFVANGLKSLPVENISGVMNADCSLDLTTDSPTVQGNATVKNFSGVRNGHTISLSNGYFYADNGGQNIAFKNLSGNIDHSTFTASGNVIHLDKDFAKWQTQLFVNANVPPEDVNTALEQRGGEVLKITAAQPFAVRGRITYIPPKISFDFNTDMKADANVAINTNYGRLVQPKGQPMALRATVNLLDDEAVITNGHFFVNKALFNISGKISESKHNLVMDFASPQPVDIAGLLPALPDMNLGAKFGDLTGTAKVSFHLAGQNATPNLTGSSTFSNVGLPQFNLNGISGVANITPVQKINGVTTANVALKIDSANYGNVALGSINGALITSDDPKKGFALQLQKFAGNIAKGTFLIDGNYLANKPGDFDLDIILKNCDANVLYKQLTGRKDQASGSLSLDLSTKGQLNGSSIMSTIAGEGSFQAWKGRIKELGSLQSKLEEAKVLEGGILGLSVGNLLAPLQSGENGEFNSVQGNYTIDHGVLKLSQFDFKGDELHLELTGEANLNDKSVRITANGDMPRMNTSGKISKATSLLSLGGIADFVAKGTPLGTPNIPVIGGISKSSKRTFTFDINATLEHPETIGKSILKTFHWTNEKHTAKVKNSEGKDKEELVDSASSN